jgi:hypothetical protein
VLQEQQVILTPASLQQTPRVRTAGNMEWCNHIGHIDIIDCLVLDKLFALAELNESLKLPFICFYSSYLSYYLESKQLLWPSAINQYKLRKSIIPLTNATETLIR